MQPEVQRAARRKLLISDSHEGIKAAASKVFKSTWQRLPGALHAKRPGAGRQDAAAHGLGAVGTVFVQESADAARTQWRSVADQLPGKFPNLGTPMNNAENDLMAFLTFPRAHWTQIYSTNPLERLNAEIERRTNVVGVFPNDASITLLVGVMMLEQNDEWSLNRRHVQLEGLQSLSDTVPTRLSAVARRVKVHLSLSGLWTYNMRWDATGSIAMDMYWRPVIAGAISLIPGANYLTGRRSRTGTGGTDAAAYCYGVWLKHLTLAQANGLSGIPETVAELGPGDSIGTGLAAMLSGADHYFALDVIAHANVDANLAVFDELVALFRARSDRPTKGWPAFDVHLRGKLFPHHILSPELLERSLVQQRVDAIRRRIQDSAMNTQDLSLQYMVPWNDPSVVRSNSVDLILSHSCLEHVDDLDITYDSMALWLRPGGFMSHQIDFTDHGLARHWNGYRTCPEWAWRLARGRGYFLINREPRSGHLARLRNAGMEVVCDMQLARPRESVVRARLAPRWATLDDADLYCSSAFIQARKSNITPSER